VDLNEASRLWMIDFARERDFESLFKEFVRVGGKPFSIMRLEVDMGPAAHERLSRAYIQLGLWEVKRLKRYDDYQACMEGKFRTTRERETECGTLEAIGDTSSLAFSGVVTITCPTIQKTAEEMNLESRLSRLESRLRESSEALRSSQPVIPPDGVSGGK
jgi:hypothetical protein